MWRYTSGIGAGSLEPTGYVRRWTQPLRVRVTGNSSSSERSIVLGYLREAAQIAGLETTMLDSGGTGENFRIDFFPEYSTPPVLAGSECVTRYWWDGASAMTRAELSIRSGSRGFARCVSHELLHAFGIPAHPNDLNSVMSYTRRGFSDYTDIDRETLRALYKAKFVPGSYHLPAMIAARQYLAETAGLVPAGGDASALARPVLDRAVERLREYAAGSASGATIIQSQLGNAYFFGQHVPRDQQEGVRFWRMAAANGNNEARYRLGMALREGAGAPADDGEAARLFQLAAAANHAVAMRMLGQHLRDGRGVAADRVEAFAWLSLAAERRAPDAVTERDALAASLSADQIEAGRARAAALAPRPPAR